MIYHLRSLLRTSLLQGGCPEIVFSKKNFYDISKTVNPYSNMFWGEMTIYDGSMLTQFQQFVVHIL